MSEKYTMTVPVYSGKRPRAYVIQRRSKETEVTVDLCLDGSGHSEIDTGVEFLDQMLALFAACSRFDLTVNCQGPARGDAYYCVEEVGTVLGQAFAQIVGNGKGIQQFGNCLLPADEALVLAVVELSGRGAFRYGLQIPSQKVGTFDTELTREFFQAFVRNSGVTLHLRQVDGENSRHIIESAFKGFGSALRQAVSADPCFPEERSSGTDKRM